MRKGIGGHHRHPRGKSDEYLTPPELLKSLGQFELDPCSPVERPWPTAKTHYTVADNGLLQPWRGRVWLNCPYGSETPIWLRRLADHGNGVALIFARTDTEMFHLYAWDRADAMLFLRGRLHFYTVRGARLKNDCGGPSVLIAYGKRNARALRLSGLAGKYISLPRES